MTNPGWHFERVGHEGGAGADAYRNTLAGAGIDLAELLPREAIQNSVDAARGEEPVVVEFRTHTFEGEELSRLRSTLQLTADSDGPITRSKLLSRERPWLLREKLSNPVRALLIEDHNTVGLGGTIHPLPKVKEDNYFGLCMRLGSAKDFEVGKGGTYGYGKSINWVASETWTVVFYSRFKPTERTEGASARLIAVSWFLEHEFDGTQFTGRAWFGDVCHSDLDRYAAPFTDEEAHRRAAALGFKLRSEDDAGLSLMILCSKIPPDELRIGAEHSWWPRILDDRLRVTFDEGIEAAPREAPDLQRYVRAWDIIHGDVEQNSELDLLTSETYKRQRLGVLAVTCFEETPTTGSATERAQIALIRSPGMVVQYMDGAQIQAGQPPTQGVFQADDGIDEILANSEPPAHNEWDHRSTRSDRPLNQEERQLIDNLLRKIRSRTREFLQKRREPPPEPPDRCEILEKMLGRHLRTEKDKPDVTRKPSPFSISFSESPARVISNGNVVVDAKAIIRLSDNAERRPYMCRIRCWLETVVEHGGVGDSLPMSFMTLQDSSGDTQQAKSEGEYSEALGILNEDEEITIDLRSLPLPHPEYRTKLVVKVDEES